MVIAANAVYGATVRVSWNPNSEPDLADWKEMVRRYYHPEKEITIALVGKYVELHDAYLSVAEALTAGGIHHSARVKIDWIDHG